MKKSIKPGRKTDDNTVTFRLPPDELLELVQRADRLQISRGLLAQYYLSQMLCVEHDLFVTKGIIENVVATIDEMRHEMAIGVEALLLASGNVSEPDARRWVKSQMKITAPDYDVSEGPPEKGS